MFGAIGSIITGASGIIDTVGGVIDRGLSRSEKRQRRDQYMRILKSRGMNSSFTLDNSDNWDALKYYSDESAKNPQWIRAINEVVGSEGGEIKGVRPPAEQFQRVAARFDELKFQDVEEDFQDQQPTKAAGSSKLGPLLLAGAAAYFLR